MRELLLSTTSVASLMRDGFEVHLPQHNEVGRTYSISFPDGYGSFTLHHDGRSRHIGRPVSVTFSEPGSYEVTYSYDKKRSPVDELRKHTAGWYRSLRARSRVDAVVASRTITSTVNKIDEDTLREMRGRADAMYDGVVEAYGIPRRYL